MRCPVLLAARVLVGSSATVPATVRGAVAAGNFGAAACGVKLELSWVDEGGADVVTAMIGPLALALVLEDGTFVVADGIDTGVACSELPGLGELLSLLGGDDAVSVGDGEEEGVGLDAVV